MNQEQYVQLVAQGYNRIPIIREVLADTETPLSVYLKLAKGKNSYFFESVQGGEKWGRYSIIGLPCRTIITVRDKKITIETDGNVQDEFVTDDPFAFLAEFKSRFKVAQITDEQRFSGGLVGYFSYDTVRFVETKLGPADNKDEIDTPDILLMLSEELVVFDNLRGTISFIINVDPHEVRSFGEAQLRLDRLQDALKTPVTLPLINDGENLSAHKFKHHFPKSEFEAAVESIKEYICGRRCHAGSTCAKNVNRISRRSD